jgi:hypothetical protein
VTTGEGWGVLLVLEAALRVCLSTVQRRNVKNRQENDRQRPRISVVGITTSRPRADTKLAFTERNICLVTRSAVAWWLHDYSVPMTPQSFVMFRLSSPPLLFCHTAVLYGLHIMPCATSETQRCFSFRVADVCAQLPNHWMSGTPS